MAVTSRAGLVVLLVVAALLFVYSLVPTTIPPPSVELVNTPPPLLLRTAPLPVWQQQLKNPLDHTSLLVLDPKLTVDPLPSQLATATTHSLTVTCHHANATQLCAPAYRLLLMGPTLVSPTYDKATLVDARTVRITFEVHDPGHYLLYAFPEHAECDLWNNKPDQYHRMAVSGAPFAIEFIGPPPSESSLICPRSGPGAHPSRWVSRAHIDPIHASIESPHWWWLHTHLIPTTRLPGATFYAYLWVPYACKKPHHSFREWIDILKPANLMFFGDSVLRDLFCLLIYTNLDGPKQTQCTWSGTDLIGYHTSHKNLTYVRQDGGTTLLSFKWLPDGFAPGLDKVLLDQAALPPTHIVFGISLWLAKKPLEFYSNRVRTTLEVLRKSAPEAKVVARTSGGVVQAIQCFDLIGGQRNQMETMQMELLRVLNDFPTIAPFDVYPIMNDRPDASTDGRHWSSVGYNWHPRPQIGSVEYALADELFFSWLP